MVFKTPTSIHENIVIGHSLAALAYSFINNYPILLNDHLNTNPFDFCAPDLDLAPFGIENISTNVNSLSGTFQRGISKLQIEAAIIMSMSLRGLILNASPITNIKISDSTLESFSSSRKYTSQYENLHLFSSNNLSGVDMSKQNVVYRVYDKINLRYFNNDQGIDYIRGDDDFVKEIFIYPSQRNGAKKSDVDLMCKSFLTKEQIKAFDYSDTMCRMKISNLLKRKGLKGRKTATHRGREYTRDISLEIDDRVVIEEAELVLVEQASSIAIHNEKFETLVRDIVKIKRHCSFEFS
jgi:hypothetical protein